MSKVLQLCAEDSCFVCGCEVNFSMLKQWSGQDVCVFCIQEINEEAVLYGSTDHY